MSENDQIDDDSQQEGLTSTQRVVYTPDQIVQPGVVETPPLLIQFEYTPDALDILQSLKNQKHRDLVVSYVRNRGKNLKKIAQESGYTSKRAHDTVSKITKRPEIKHAIEALQKLANSEAVLDVQRRKELLSDFAEGRRVLAKRKVGSTPKGVVDVTEYSAPDPVGAIAELNRMTGAYPPAKLLVDNVSFNLDFGGHSLPDKPDVPKEQQEPVSTDLDAVDIGPKPYEKDLL